MDTNQASSQITPDELNTIEAGINNMDYSGATVQCLIDEIRRQRELIDLYDIEEHRLRSAIEGFYTGGMTPDELLFEALGADRATEIIANGTESAE